VNETNVQKLSLGKEKKETNNQILIDRKGSRKLVVSKSEPNSPKKKFG